MKYALFLPFVCGVFACASPKINLSDEKNWALQPITKVEGYNPVLEPERRSEFFCTISKKNIRWEEARADNPAAVNKDGRIYLLYRAEDQDGIARIGITNARDGLQFKRNPIPVLFPGKDAYEKQEWPGGCEDPRIVKRADGEYIMTYTAYDQKVAKLFVATSPDLYRWEKQGPAFRQKKYEDRWSKAGAIVCENINGEMIAKKIDGKYWMYWGDSDIFLATSEDGINWTPVTVTAKKSKGELLPVLSPRPGYADSRSVTPGPFALASDKGILLLYTGLNDAAVGDKTLPDHACTLGQVLFDPKKPQKTSARAAKHFLVMQQAPDKGNTAPRLANGLVWLNDRWLLYYGEGDGNTAVAEIKGVSKN